MHADTQYARLHWGLRATRDAIGRVFSGALRRGPSLAALSYRTEKGGDGPQTYRHAFEPIDGRGPELFGPHFDGAAVAIEPLELEELPVLGRLIDLETDDGAHLAIAGSPLIAVAGPLGRSARIVLLGVPYALERREAGPYVTAHGIEG